MYRLFIKRLLDVIASLILLFVLSPLLILVYLLVKFKMGSPVIFTQDRVGYKNKIFTLYKFRSMNDATDENGVLLPDCKRTSSLGDILRKTSIDELPQLLNIIKGDMSFIGPRPWVSDFLPYYTKEEIKRHNTRPGITGLAQVMGRNCISYDERIKFDLKYVDKITFFKDVRIFFYTIYIVFCRLGVENPNESNNLNTGSTFYEERGVDLKKHLDSKL